MDKERLVQIAERNLNKARKALEVNCTRKGITDDEINNLHDNVKYAEVVCDLITYHVQENWRT